jgi:hypothetical protein
LTILNKKISHRCHTYKKKKEKIARDLLQLDRGHRPQLKELAELVQTSLQKDARRHQKKLHGLLEQCPVKAK